MASNLSDETVAPQARQAEIKSMLDRVILAPPPNVDLEDRPATMNPRNIEIEDDGFDDVETGLPLALVLPMMPSPEREKKDSPRPGDIGGGRKTQEESKNAGPSTRSSPRAPQPPAFSLGTFLREPRPSHRLDIRSKDNILGPSTSARAGSKPFSPLIVRLPSKGPPAGSGPSTQISNSTPAISLPHDLSAASYLARQTSQQTRSSVPAETRTPAEIITEDRIGTYQKIELAFQQQWDKRRKFIQDFKIGTGINIADSDAKRRDSTADVQSDEALLTARNGAMELLLKAWWERLGTHTADGWTKYNDKTSTRACVTLKEILEKGDIGLGIPVEAIHDREKWATKMRELKWWFTSLNNAIDFLAAFGVGKHRIGSAVVRIEVLQYSGFTGGCLSPDHHQSEQAWIDSNSRYVPENFPPVRLCPCAEFKLLLKTIANNMEMPDANNGLRQRALMADLRKDWQKENQAGFEQTKVWPKEVNDKNKPMKLPLRGIEFHLWFYGGMDHVKKMAQVAVRLEGRFAELL